MLTTPRQVATPVEARAIVVSNVEIAAHTYRLRLACPELATRFQPGQFLMLRLPGRTDPLLGRPYALYDTYADAQGNTVGFDIGYHVIGKQTGLLTELIPGQVVDLWGPLGNGFPQFTGKHLACVAGGIGYTPMIAMTLEALGVKTYGQSTTISQVAQAFQPVRRVSMLYGARSKSHLAKLHELESLPNATITVATDDGSAGHKGFITEPLDDLLAKGEVDAVYCCGPELMMKRVAQIAASHNVPCWLSLETPMACGIGACFSCVVKVKDDSEDGWDYKRSCIEGPIFEAEKLLLS
ncbi:dihydroorotate dehydrogenase electron transfer subunit [Lacunimicrobium album]